MWVIVRGRCRDRAEIRKLPEVITHLPAGALGPSL
jgi:hypothetical protein